METRFGFGNKKVHFVVIGADLAELFCFFEGGDGYREVFVRISGYQKHIHLCPLPVNIGLQ